MKGWNFAGGLGAYTDSPDQYDILAAEPITDDLDSVSNN